MMEFAVQRWLSVDAEDGDIVREVAAQLPAVDKPPGRLLTIILFSAVFLFLHLFNVL